MPAPAKPQVHDFVKSVDTYRLSEITFTLNIEAWRSASIPGPLAWNSVDFKPERRSDVPRSRGIYAFIIEPRVANFPAHGYLVYVGITAAPGRTLRKRFNEYHRAFQSVKRERLLYILYTWYDHMRFYYAEVDPAHDLATLEQTINDTFVPPGVTGDFSAEVRPKTRALNL